MRERAARVERDDLGVRAVGAQENGVQLAGQVPVGGVAAVAGDEAEVFAAHVCSCERDK